MATLDRIFPFGEGSETLWSAGGIIGYQNWAGFFTSESPAQIPFPKCTILKINLRILTNNMDANTVFTLRKNGADTGITFTVATGVVGLQSATGAILVEDGDLLCLEVDGSLSSGGNSIAFQGGSIIYV